jgi:arsenite methyltransferase
MKDEKIRKAVREGYAEVAKTDSTCYTPADSCCCGSDLARDISRNVGYSDEDIEAVPEGANLGLGCGNPVALASLKEGDVVIDLGSGAGFDSFLAAREVGREGRVIGIDMTPEMLDKARENAEKGGFENVEFRLGEIEHLPVADSSVDVIISNCVINLVPDKRAVFSDAFRVLKPGGRLMVSDIVLLRDLPDVIKSSVSAYVGCLAGAVMKDEYIGAIESAGFSDVEITEQKNFPIKLMANDPTTKAVIENMDIPREKLADVAEAAVSIGVRAVKP